MKTIDKNIINLFVQDTHLCSVHGLQLMKYQMEKHGWTSEQWNEYYEIYKQKISSFTVLSGGDISSFLNEKKEINIKITNQELKKVQAALSDILTNIESNIEVLGDEKLSDYFLQPIIRCTADISDKVFIQTKDTVNEIHL